MFKKRIRRQSQSSPFAIKRAGLNEISITACPFNYQIQDFELFTRKQGQDRIFTVTIQNDFGSFYSNADQGLIYAGIIRDETISRMHPVTLNYDSNTNDLNVISYEAGTIPFTSEGVVYAEIPVTFEKTKDIENNLAYISNIQYGVNIWPPFPLAGSKDIQALENEDLKGVMNIKIGSSLPATTPPYILRSYDNATEDNPATWARETYVYFVYILLGQIDGEMADFPEILYFNGYFENEVDWFDFSKITS